MIDLEGIDWAKGDGLVPAIVQDADSAQVLMLGYMNRAALEHTLASRRVTFYSRSRGRLWTKGEQSGHVLDLVAVTRDCDCDTLLVLARPQGPTCHLGCASCFGEEPPVALSFLARLDALVGERERTRPPGSYTTRLFQEGLTRIAQKVGEEGVETALAAVAATPEALVEEAADLLFHLLVLLRARGLDVGQVLARLRARHRR
jgi:phosphoribosyl-ATP pyrophosphohydrolase/phosphoribosyl-AMP cyclohydrolase